MPVKFDVAVRLPLRLSQIFGLFPFDYRTMNRSVWSIATISLAIVISINLYVTLNSSNPLGFDAFITNIFRILSVIPWMSTMALLITSLTIRPGFFRVVKRIRMMERRLSGNSKPFKVLLLFSLDLTVRTATIFGEIYASHLLVRGKPLKQFIIRLIGFYLTHFIQNVYELQFLAFVHFLANWFHSLSRRLSPKNVSACMESFNDLTVASVELNETFKFQNFMTVSNCVLLCIVDCYIYQTTSTGLLTPVGLNTFLRVALRVYQVSVFIISAANLTKQVRQFDDVLYALALADHTNWLICDVKIKEHFYQRVTIVLTGWNTFSLDLFQLHSIVALLINYLIILHQFGGSKHTLK